MVQHNTCHEGDQHDAHVQVDAVKAVYSSLIGSLLGGLTHLVSRCLAI